MTRADPQNSAAAYRTYWPCTDLPLVAPFYDECWGDCLSFAPVVAGDGSVDCHVVVSTTAPSCDNSYGWLDPAGPDGTRAPLLVEEQGALLRHCELAQLTGAALESCVNSLACPDCEPGWCYTQVRELWGGCDENPNAFRFVVGSDRAATGIARIRCDTVVESSLAPTEH